MMIRKKAILLSLLFVISSSLYAQNWGSGKKIKGNGNVITKTRTVAYYNGIGVGGSFDVHLVKGKERKITIQGEENIIPYIITEVKNNTLEVKYKKNINIRNSRRVVITIAYDRLEKVSLGGSGNVESKELIESDDFKVSLAGSGNIALKIDANQVRASIGGSGNIRLIGDTDTFDCSIAGSGSIKAYDLNADALSATIAGSGNIRATVKSKIKAKIVGSGSIYYKGKPAHIKSKSVGSGDIIDKNIP